MLLGPLLFLIPVVFSSPSRSSGVPQWQALSPTGVDVNLRGLSAVSKKVIWASGVDGTVLRTVDGGVTWEDVSVKEANGTDFRDIEAWDSSTALVMGVSSPALFYQTTDGGQTWTNVHRDEHESVFYNAMDFWDDDKNGIAVGDAIDGKIDILFIFDRGARFERLALSQRPDSPPGVHGFAASGTCLTTYGDKDVYFGLGGDSAPIFMSKDRGQSWEMVETPIAARGPSEGIFSVAFKSSSEGIIVGGDYGGDGETDIDENAAITEDGGNTWKLVNCGNGYRSSAVFFDNYVLTTGRYSSDRCFLEMNTFEDMNGQYFSISATKNDDKGVFASGSEGRVAVLRV